jgi:hypothetical protein
MSMDASRLLVLLLVAAGLGTWALSIVVVITAFIRARRRIKTLEERHPMPTVPVPAFVLHLVPPLVIGGMMAYAVSAGRGADLAPLCATACASVIIQIVVAGLFGLGRAMLPVAGTAIFVFVEVLIAGVIFAATCT